MAEETGDETIADVLERVGALKKDEMVEEVEAYGLEVHSSWTKDEIMDHFEEFLVSPPESEPEEPAEEPATTEKVDGAPEPIALEDNFSEAAVANNAAAREELPPEENPQVRITASRGWGKTGGAHAP